MYASCVYSNHATLSVCINRISRRRRTSEEATKEEEDTEEATYRIVIIRNATTMRCREVAMFRSSPVTNLSVCECAANHAEV